MLQILEWDKFGYLTIEKEIKRDIWNNWSIYRKFLCKCVCWKFTNVRLKKLRKWDTKSCWCLRVEKNKQRCIKHWMTNTKIYYVFNNLFRRCNKITHKKYKDYWWRGIHCEWNTFEEFYKDMWSSYKEWLTIDRRNNDWNYSKSNCRWVTSKIQARNTRNNILYKWKCIAERSDILWLKYITLYMKIRRWTSIEQILINNNK